MDVSVQKTCVAKRTGPGAEFKPAGVLPTSMNAASDAGVYARRSELLDRVVELGVASGRVISVSFPQEAPSDADEDHTLLDRVFAALDGDQDFSSIEFALTVPTDARAVLETVRTVPPGETVTTHQVARMAPQLDPESETDLQTVRTALAENPIPLVVPDHRVTDADGATPADVAERLRRVES